MLSLILLVIVCVANTLLGLAVIVNNRKLRLNQVFGCLTFALVAWSVVTFLEDATLSLAAVRVLAVLDFSLSAIMIMLFLLFSSELSRRSLVVLKRAAYIACLGLCLLIFFGQVIVAEKQVQDVILVPRRGFVVFLLYASVGIGVGLWLLFKRLRESRGIDRSQLKFILLGLASSSITLVITNIVLPKAFHLASPLVSRAGIYSILLFSGASAYAIIKHRFLDIRIIVARSVTYTLLLVSFGSIYGLALFGTSSLFFKGKAVSVAQNIVYIGLALTLAFTFQPLRRFFERLTDRVFYRDRYDSQEVLNAIGKTLAEEILLEKILQGTLQQICSHLRVEVGQFMIFNKGAIYKAEHFGPLPKKIMVASTMRKLRQSILVADELEGGERKQILDEYGVRVSLMLRTRDEFVGFLFLGDKMSGDIYSNQDLQLLGILAQELSIALVNAKAYEEIQEFNRTLQERVSQATARLRVANHNLKALDKAKDEFISMASHQLRTPLTTIKGYLSMILEGDAGPASNQQIEFINYAYNGAERMVSLISDLLNVSRLSAGRFVIERKPTDLVAVVADEVRQLQSHAAAKNLELVFAPPKNKLPLIDLDEGKTRQVIMNFIDNAVYYTKQGGVYLTLEADKKSVRLLVRDTGIGVPEVAKRKLFSKFFRAQNAQAARPDGTGLGLFLAKKVIEDQGGSVIFESIEGQGSTFGFTIPMRISAKSDSKSVQPKVQLLVVKKPTYTLASSQQPSPKTAKRVLL